MLRIAVAGNRRIGRESEAALSSRLIDLFATIEAAVVSVPSGGSGGDATVSRPPPALRLVSGLADGADQIAAGVFLASRSAGAERSIAAVLPFDVATYRDRSSIHCVARFEKLLGACRYVLELDGRHAEGDDGPARRSRATAYRTQAAVLLRQADVLVAIEDPDADARSGGTRETIARALYLGIPVIHVPVGTDRIAVLRTGEDGDLEAAHGRWRSDVETIVHALLADPRASAEIAASGSRSAREDSDLGGRRRHEDDLLREFFAVGEAVPWRRRRLWSHFERWFLRGDRAGSDAVPAPFRQWKSRASALSADYAGLYRGTFLLNYSLAVLAVILAVGAQIVLILFPGVHRAGDEPWIALVVLGAANAAVLVGIRWLTRQANRHRWNDKAVDYRYLAERLRSMAYLPQTGSLQAVPPGSAGYATRVSTTSVVDWAFQAMVRHVSLEEVTRPLEARGPIRLQPHAAAIAIRDGWIAHQASYHARTGDAMRRMSETFDKTGRLLSTIVVGVVVAELAILVLGGLHLWRPGLANVFLHAGPWLLLLEAVLPAAVASLNGIRFQTECARLADRSMQMGRLLDVLRRRAEALIAEIDQDRRESGSSSGRALAVLHLAEDCAKLTLDEVAEWSFVYAKEIVEP